MIPEPQKTYLLELITALGPASKELVLVGGHALRFMISSPRATKDFDFVLNVTYLRECDTLLASVLTSLGYLVAENAKNFQFEKPIPNSNEVMRVEFMAPAEFARKDKIRVEVQPGVHGRACVGGTITVAETDVYDLSGSLPDGKPVQAKVRVTRPHALVLLKLLAMDDRYHNVRGTAHAEHDRQEAKTHVNDIVSVLRARTNFMEFRRAFVSQFGVDSDLKARTRKIIEDYFGDESKPGLVLYQESLTANLPSSESARELGAEVRSAQRLVFSLILELGR